MTDERISPLRARMIEDMRIRGMGEKAQKSHIRAIKDFAQFLGHSPDTATPEELRAYQLHMTDTGVTASTFNVRIVALRFFFGMSRYTHRVAISNHRLISADAETVAFRWKDYRIKSGDRQKVMRLATTEFIRRFLMHVLPDGFHRIRHYGLLAGATRKATITRIRDLLGQEPTELEAHEPAEPAPLTLREPCPCCGGPMRIVEIFRRGQKPMSRAPPREQAA